MISHDFNKVNEPSDYIIENRIKAWNIWLSNAKGLMT